MSRASNGTYTLPAGNPVVTSTIISSTWANSTLNDLATEMTDSLDRSGKGGMLAPLQLSDGTAALPGLTFVTEPTSGLFRISAGLIGLSVLNSTKVSFNTNGQVTINGGSVAGGGALLINLQGTTTNGILMTGTSATFMQPLMVRNLSNGVAAVNFGLEVANDTAGKELYLANTSTTFNTSFIGNIPVGAAGALVALNNQFAIAVGGTGNSAQLLIDATTSLVKTWEGTNNVATPAGSLLQSTTQESGSFTATSVGITGTPGGTVNWSRVGTFVTLTFPSITGASSSTSLTFTGLPAGLQPARAQRGCVMLEDNTAFVIGSLTVAVGSGTITAVRPDNAAFTGAGTKGIIASTITYPLN